MFVILYQLYFSDGIRMCRAAVAAHCDNQTLIPSLLLKCYIYMFVQLCFEASVLFCFHSIICFCCGHDVWRWNRIFGRTSVGQVSEHP